MLTKKYQFSSKLWMWGPVGKAKYPWYFITVPTSISQEIKAIFGWSAVGFGSIPVQVAVGKSIWKTSLFPSKKDGAKNGSYLLPIKAIIRKNENLETGNIVKFKLVVK